MGDQRVGDVMGGVVPVKYSEDIAAETKKAKRIFESFMQQRCAARNRNDRVAVIRLVG